MDNPKTSVLLSLLALIILPSGANGLETFLHHEKGSLFFTVQTPSFELEAGSDGQNVIRMEGGSCSGKPGYPDLPTISATFALPPGTKPVKVEISGSRMPVEGSCRIKACAPALPLSDDIGIIENQLQRYERVKEAVYSGEIELSRELGMYIFSECREYALVTVNLHPFFYDPCSEALSVTSSISVGVDYEPCDAEHARFINNFMKEGTQYPEVPGYIVNKDQARTWYRPCERLISSPGMLILTTEDHVDYLGPYISWRESTGFEVTIATFEEIESSSAEGVDTEQRIRNWLRAISSEYQYLLIIGGRWDIPMRELNYLNDIDPYNNRYVYPHPSDAYYADLSEPDSVSWDADGDGLYGEVCDSLGNWIPDDQPDVDAELHVGRIVTLPAELPEILERTWLFEASEDQIYKNTSVLAGGIIWYPNIEDSGWPGYDGAQFMEYLKSTGVVDSTIATTLYETEGDGPSMHTPDIPQNHDNLVSTLQSTNAGLFVEYNHGWMDFFGSEAWYDLNEDGIPQYSELAGRNHLENADCSNLNSSHPNVAILMSCLCGAYDIKACLAEKMLEEGSVGVVTHTRGPSGRHGWSEPGDAGFNDLIYAELENLLVKDGEYDHVLGDAFSAAKSDYGKTYAWDVYQNIYVHTLFGDPALRLTGREGIIPEGVVSNPSENRYELYLTPDRTVHLSLAKSGMVILDIWDALGRRVHRLYQGNLRQGYHTMSWDVSQQPSGSYFVTLNTSGKTRVAKVVVLD